LRTFAVRKNAVAGYLKYKPFIINTMSSIIYTLHIATIISLLLSGIFIVTVRGFKSPTLYTSLDRFVSAFLVTVNIFQTYHTPIYGQLLWNPLHLLMGMSVYPFMFAYIFDMVRPGCIRTRFWLTAYLPPAVLAALFFIFEALFGRLPLFSRYADLRNFLDMPQLWVLFAAAAFSIAMISLYTVRAVGQLRLHRRNLTSDFSSLEGNTLGWMGWAIGITLFKWLLLMARITVEGHTFSLAGLFLFTVEPVIITALILRQKDLYGATASNGKDFEQPDDGSEVTPEKSNLLKQRLLALLEKDGVYKNPDLDRTKLSEMMNTNRTRLSLIINRDMNTTFFDLINTCRINKSLELMKDPLHRDMSISTIAELCGFKSLSAFRMAQRKQPRQ
jgi:AraC-like DNA-binding protein